LNHKERTARGTRLAPFHPSFIGLEEAGTGRRARDGQASSGRGSSPGDTGRKQTRSENEGAQQQEGWFRDAPNKHNEKQKKISDQVTPAPQMRGFFLFSWCRCQGSGNLFDPAARPPRYQNRNTGTEGLTEP